MKANSKRRVLVSSVAMLLVALISLSTATFAWFTSSTTATANGINVTTSKASKLQISSVNVDWGTLIDYDVDNKLLLPTSTATGTSWFKADADKDSEFTLKAGTVESVTDLSNYVIADQLNVRNAGEATVEGVTITFTVPDNYLRVALVPAAEKGANAALSDDFTKHVYDADGVAYTGLTATDGTGTSITPKTTYTINVGDLTKDQVKYFNLYVWFEGQDVDCYDANAGAEVSDIEFKVTGTTDEQV